MITLIIRPADHAELPSLLDICIHRNPEDERYAPEDAGAALDHMLRYEAICGMHPLESEPTGLGRELADVRPTSGMPNNIRGVRIG